MKQGDLRGQGVAGCAVSGTPPALRRSQSVDSSDEAGYRRGSEGTQEDGGGMIAPREAPPPAVPVTAQQGGEVQERWLWVEPAVWTERMLTALEEGVKGDVWFRLIDKVWTEGNVLASYAKV